MNRYRVTERRTVEIVAYDLDHARELALWDDDCDLNIDVELLEQDIDEEA